MFQNKLCTTFSKYVLSKPSRYWVLELLIRFQNVMGKEVFSSIFFYLTFLKLTEFQKLFLPRHTFFCWKLSKYLIFWISTFSSATGMHVFRHIFQVCLEFLNLQRVLCRFLAFPNFQMRANLFSTFLIYVWFHLFKLTEWEFSTIFQFGRFCFFIWNMKIKAEVDPKLIAGFSNISTFLNVLKI